MVDTLRSGLAGQIGIHTEALHAPGTEVTVSDFIEYQSEGIVRDSVVIESQGMAGTLFPRSGRRRRVFRGATGPMTIPILNTGMARILRHAFGGYTFSWPGSTNGTATLTLGGAVPTAGDTVTIGTQVYSFESTLSSANDVLIGADVNACAANLAAAINRGANSAGQGEGEIYHADTPRNADVDATSSTNTVTVTDRQGRGDAVNSGGASEIATTETLTDVSNVWDNATLTGGVDGTDTRYRHTYTFDGSLLRELAATIQNVRPATESSRKVWTYIGAKIISWELSHSGDGELMFTPTWHARSESLATAIATASYPSAATFFDFTEAALTIDAVSEAMQGFSLSMNLGLSTDRYQMGTSAPRNQLVTERPSLTGNLDHEFEDLDLYNAFLNQTAAALVYTATGDTIPSSASPYLLSITLPEVVYDGETPTVDGPGLVDQPIPFTVLDDGSNEPITVVYDTDEGYAGDDG